MKKVIKLLEEAEGYITPLMGMDRDFCKMAASRIHDAIGILENPPYLTVAEWEEKNGETLRDDAAVWVSYENRMWEDKVAETIQRWRLFQYGEIKDSRKKFAILVSNGYKPTSENWRKSK